MRILAAALAALLLLAEPAQATNRLVPSVYATIRLAAQACVAGDTVTVASGTYTGDVATWNKANLVVKAASPPTMPHLIANGSSENDMGVWRLTTGATNFTADGFEIEGGISSSGYNGAAIRVESGNTGWVAIRNCHFHDNQMNILAAPDSLFVEKCELDHTISVPFNPNTGEVGHQHNIYVNTSFCRVVVFQGNYSHDTAAGQLFKSRARTSYVLYNRLSDQSGNGDYQIDISDGGRTVILGNIIVQGINSPNTALVAYAPESANNSPLDLYLTSNTLVNEQSTSGSLITIRGGTTAKVMNNIFYGTGAVPANGGSFTVSNNYIENPATNAAHFQSPSTYDYRLTSTTPVSIVNAGASPGTTATGFSLTPASSYVYDSSLAARTMVGQIDIGAFEWNASGTPPPSGPSCVNPF